MKKLTTLLAAILLVACSADEPVTDLEGLKAMRGEWQAAFDAKDAVAIAALYTANGTVHPPNAKKVKSRPAIQSFWADFMASGSSAAISDTEVNANGDIGYKVGTYMMTDPAGAPLDVGKYVEVWHYIDGRWQMLHDIYNSDMPLPEPPPPPAAESEAEVFDDFEIEEEVEVE